MEWIILEILAIFGIAFIVLVPVYLMGRQRDT